MPVQPRNTMPYKDRRSSRRILTMRNATIAFALALAVFIAISVYSELRPDRISTEPGGRLYTKRTPAVPPPELRPSVVIPEDVITDQTAANPMLTETIDDERILGVREVPTNTVSPDDDGPPAGEPLLGRVSDPSRRKARFKISNEGDQGGVRVDVK